MSDKKLMFRPRRNSWGLTPNTASGWGALVAWLLIFILPVELVAQFNHSNLPLLLLSLAWVLLGVIAMIIFVVKYLKKYYPDYY